MQTQYKLFFRKIMLSLIIIMFLGGISSLVVTFDSSAASSLKVKYNGKTYRNKSKKMTVKYNSKTISKSSYKALVIKKSYMVPYTDIFKSGVKATCTYTKKTKTLTIKKNSVTIKMKIGSKTAYVNGKKTKLTTAPLSVKFVKKKKTKILVPISFVASSLKLSYQKAGSTITLKDPLVLSYDNATVYYNGVQGTLFYNHKNYTLSTMPVIKLNGNMYLPAEETIDKILKLEYDYNESTGKISIANEDINLDVSCQVNSNIVSINEKNTTMSAPVKIVKNIKTNKSVVCLPASSILKALNYTRAWNKSAKYYSAQSQTFFDWENELTNTQKETTTTNYIHKMIASYSSESGTGSINFKLSGSNAELLKTLTVKRSGNTITITMPSSKYNLTKKSFGNFGEIVNKMDIVESNDTSDTVTLSLTCEGTADYSYIVQNNTLELNVLYTYSNSTGSVTSYSLSIAKPANTTIANVTNQDLYQSKKFKVIIAGNHLSFYQANPIVINNNTVKNVAVALNGTNTEITITTSSLRGFKIFERGNNFVVTMGAPKSIYKSILVLDAGHGGFDPGAQNKGTNEKDLNFKILYTLMKQYFSSNAPDIKVYWTRTSDTFITLSKRASFAKSVSADAFISLHMNSASTSANGTEVYYSVSNNSKSFSGITSKKIATLFKNKLINDLGTKNRGTKSAAYYVLKHNTVPSALIELGFISGSSDYARLTNSTFQNKAAKSIYDGIVSMFNTYPTGR